MKTVIRHVISFYYWKGKKTVTCRRMRARLFRRSLGGSWKTVNRLSKYDTMDIQVTSVERLPSDDSAKKY